MEQKQNRPILTWWVGGLLLGLTMVLAVAVKKPLGVSTQYVVAEGVAISKIAPESVQTHALLSNPKYQKFGYGWYLVVGLFAGALVASILAGRFSPELSACNYAWANGGLGKRMLFSLVGGFLVLLGARIAGGCTSGMFASGWAQLSLSAVPFTIVMFGFGILVARYAFPRTPSQS